MTFKCGILRVLHLCSSRSHGSENLVAKNQPGMGELGMPAQRAAREGLQAAGWEGGEDSMSQAALEGCAVGWLYSKRLSQWH